MMSIVGSPNSTNSSDLYSTLIAIIYHNFPQEVYIFYFNNSIKVSRVPVISLYLHCENYECDLQLCPLVINSNTTLVVLAVYIRIPVEQK